MSKLDNTYTTREFDAVIVENEGKKRPKVVHEIYFSYELNQFKTGEHVLLSVTSKKPKRTKRQNNFYHLYLSLISLSSGHTLKQLKAWTKGRFLSEGISEVFGDKTRVVKSTTELRVLEFIEFMSRIEETVEVPMPDPQPFKLALTQKEWEELKAEQKERYKKFKPVIK